MTLISGNIRFMRIFAGCVNASDRSNNTQIYDLAVTLTLTLDLQNLFSLSVPSVPLCDILYKRLRNTLTYLLYLLTSVISVKFRPLGYKISF